MLRTPGSRQHTREYPSSRMLDRWEFNFRANLERGMGGDPEIAPPARSWSRTSRAVYLPLRLARVEVSSHRVIGVIWTVIQTSCLRARAASHQSPPEGTPCYGGARAFLS